MDTIVTEKSLQCQAEGIQLTCTGNGQLLDFIDPMDLAALLGNMLDNAIEHTGALSDPSLRWIELAVRERNSFVILEVGNHYDGTLVFRNGLPQSTKGDERYHGYGTRSIQNTAAKYNGSASFRAENGWFEANVSFVRP